MSKSARMQACVFLCKTYTESKQTKIFKEELIFKRIVASPQTSNTPDLHHDEQQLASYKIYMFSAPLCHFPIPSLHHNSWRLFPFRAPFLTQPRPPSWQPLPRDGWITTFGNEQRWLAFVGCPSREAKCTFHPFVPTGPSLLPLLSAWSGSTSRKPLPRAIPE